VFFMFVKVKDGRLVDVKYLVRGCGAAIATCSALSQIALGKSIEEAMRLSDDDIAQELGGLPLQKLHCSNLAATVLHRALDDYEARRRAGLPPHHIELRPDDDEQGDESEEESG
jgi:nitrogen fixation NifU-like protein